MKIQIEKWTWSTGFEPSIGLLNYTNTYSLTCASSVWVRMQMILISPIFSLSFNLPLPFFNPADPLELKLVGGHSRCSGRLQVLHHGMWGSVCDDGWGEQEDQVVCKQMGCGKSLSPSMKERKIFGPGVGRIWLDDVDCSGNEQSLELCQHRFWGRHDCTHEEDVAVICSGKSYAWNSRG